MSTSHPLDPLTAEEFRRAASVLRRERVDGPRWRFASIELKEPGKDALQAGEPAPREALVICWNRDDGRAYDLVANPVQIDETADQMLPAPEHGQHTEDILLELGFDWEAIIAYKESGAVL